MLNLDELPRSCKI